MEPRASADAKSVLARRAFQGGFAAGSGKSAAKFSFGSYPTPVQELAALSRGKCGLWVKRDDLTSPLYGGNKVRKLEYLLADAHRKGATHLVTIGAVGSHHVLATTLYGAREGFLVDAVLMPQPRTDHVVEVVRAGLAHGLRPTTARGLFGVLAGVLPIAWSRDGYFIMVGGSSVVGSLGYVDAARELAAQVRAGEMPEPDVIVVALGSGGTVAGITAGLEASGLRSKVLGVVVADPPRFISWRARRLARACLRRIGVAGAPGWLEDWLTIDPSWLGRGYGHPTPEGAQATEAAAREGLTLDPTYTAKTMAAALARVAAWEGADAPKTVLYWHTLSGAPMAPLLAGAVEEGSIDARVRGLYA